MQWLLMRPWTQGIPWFHCLQAGGGEPRRVSFGGIATTATKDAIRLYLGFGDHTMALRWGRGLAGLGVLAVTAGNARSKGMVEG